MSGLKTWKDDVQRFSEKEIVDLMKRRRLASKCPLLLRYLSPGMRVLDVGCSAGTMTIDIAEAVVPGTVTGVDIAGSAIDTATKDARTLEAENVDFRIGDTYNLEFPDDTFDLTCSLALLVHLRDPVRALQEQKRVTKQGGYVIASIGDFGSNMIYPLCPTLEKIISAWARFREEPDHECFVNFNMGREALEVFSRAGLVDIDLQPYFAPSEQSLFKEDEPDIRSRFGAMPFLVDMDKTGPFLRRLIERGLVSEQDLVQARDEIRVWEENPYAVYMSATVLAVGTVA